MGIGRYFETLWLFLRTWTVNVVGRITIADVIDMLIIAFVIYKLLQFLRKSRLGLIARSIVVLILVVWISGHLNLMTLNFVTSQAMEMGILALIILFHQEIRQTLERLGKGNIGDLFSGESKRQSQKMEWIIAQTVAACTRMAEDRTGVLLVFERKIGLEEEVKTGTLLDAQFSAELLMNIFNEKAPLHDGAVIVRNGRMASAGCMLPLSDNPSLSRDLGMRHRAGIGVSERSDAVVVIVSEETGSISVAVNGILRRHLAQDSFENLLRKELLVDEAPRRSRLLKLLGGKNT
ncbi:MAG: diadenylate cyclase CdaA [Oscillospiraceae bacterium]|nr:diadenylate cyclase CdaA [Oscillospiraceae bacterium]